MRSRRPMRCSTTVGLHGRSKRTRRRQNSKFRPSPPASVESIRAGPSGSRNCATSMSRRSGVSSSWKRPARARPWRSISRLSMSSVSRWATKTSVFSPACCQRAACSTSQRARGSARSAAAIRSRRGVSSGPVASGASAAGEARARATRSALRRSARGLPAGSARTAFSSRSSASHPGSSISTGAGTRGGRPPMSARRVELVQGGSGARRARRSAKLSSSGNSSGRSSWRRRKKPWASSSSGVAVSSRAWRPRAAIGATAR